MQSPGSIATILCSRGTCRGPLTDNAVLAAVQQLLQPEQWLVSSSALQDNQLLMLSTQAFGHRGLTSNATSMRSSIDRDVTAVAVVHALQEVLELLLVDDTIPVSTTLCELRSLHRGCDEPCYLRPPQSYDLIMLCPSARSQQGLPRAKPLHVTSEQVAMQL